MKRSPRLAFVVAILAGTTLHGGAAPAQARSAEAYATITGAVIDSIHRGYLGGAHVTVIGTSRSATTDSAGRFTIDSIPPGDRELEVLDPFLDTLAIRLRVSAMKLAPGSNTSVAFAVPSPQTYANSRCSKELQKYGQGVLVGIVLDADTEAPSEDAEVALEWTDLLQTKNGVQATQQRRAAQVWPDGTYIVCGIPTDLETGVLASSGADSTDLISASFEHGVAVQVFHLPRRAAWAAGKVNRGPASLTGIVTDAKGNPLSEAYAAIDADRRTTRTSEDGTFTLSELRSGTRRLTVRRAGMEAVHMAVDLSAARAEHVTVKMVWPIAGSKR